MPKPPSELFSSTIVPSQPVTCLGKTFTSNDERRAYFTEELRKRLADPDFRKIEGFPIGKDEDILALSDPPYYTACPNPWLEEFIAEWENQKEKLLNETPYHREPFAADVSEGKNDPIYNAHSYHTKVPHKAIMRYILHYTNPGDIVFDGFCGTGMTGVAAQMCGNKAEVESLGYKVEEDGKVLQEETDEKGVKYWKAFSKLGARKAVLNDLSPAATFIAYNYNTPVDVAAFEKEAKRILTEVEAECSWMYETTHTDGETKGVINYTVWSDVFVCPECSKEIIFWEVAVDKEAGEVKDEFPCPHCSAKLTKRRMERAWITKFDTAINESIKQAKQIPILINYSIKTDVRFYRFEKEPDKDDIILLEKINSIDIPNWFPSIRMMEGGETRRNDFDGITHIHHFYTKRNLIELAVIREKVFQKKNDIHALGLWFTSSHPWVTRLSRLIISNYFRKTGGVIAPTLQGTLYISSLSVETNAVNRFQLRINSCPYTANFGGVTVFTSSTSSTNIPSNSIDYLFLDPPFGSNIAYSELNFLWEAWLLVFTAYKEEAIENKEHNKSLNDYTKLIRQCFIECYRILKPGHWITVEFSNTKASVWNAIQSTLGEAGFVVANVSILEKLHKGYRAVTTPTAVKQDLVISAYKPNGGFEERFVKKAGTEEGIWDFIRTHLSYLPVVRIQNKEFIPVDERQPRILFDHVISYYVRKGIEIPIASSQAFQSGLKERFAERDGMYFLHEQAMEYDNKKLQTVSLKQPELFVNNEGSAILWLKSLLSEKPQTMQDIHPEYMQKLTGFDKKEIRVELKTLLEQNFIVDNTGKWHVPDPENIAHIEKIREKALLKEFDNYKSASHRIKVFRIEAVRAGFKKSYNDRDYETIINIADRLPADAIEEDPMLLLWYTSAKTRLGRD